jgi:hypothetical protein
MYINGCDCSIVIKTTHHEFNVPYSEETIREAVSYLKEEASIEGDGTCKAIVKKNGVTGCIVTPLTIRTVPLLMYLAFGTAGIPVFVSETRNIYQYKLNLTPIEDSNYFDLIQDRRIRNEKLGMSNERKIYEGCRVKSFELRTLREEAIKLKLDVCGERAAKNYLYINEIEKTTGERFKSNCVDYRINSEENHFIYGITLSIKKENGTKTEVWIRRTLHTDFELPEIINELKITAHLKKDKYEYNRFGIFRIALNNLVMISDETNVNSTDTVIGPVRYYVAGNVSTEVFTSGEEIL